MRGGCKQAAGMAENNSDRGISLIARADSAV